jgi:hypothetical protein
MIVRVTRSAIDICVKETIVCGTVGSVEMCRRPALAMSKISLRESFVLQYPKRRRVSLRERL